MRKAVYAGSFDPPTNGHAWMIGQARELFDEVHVVIATNPAKRSSFSVGDRFSMLSAICQDAQAKVLVSELPSYQLLASWAINRGVQYIVRGIRNPADYEYERGMRHVNEDIALSVSTVFLMPPRDLGEVSSSLIMGLVGLTGWRRVVERYVPEGVLPYLDQVVERRELAARIVR